jgi:hypothetical protein
MKPKEDNFYLQTILSQAQESYPFVKQHNPVVALGQGQGFAETWPPEETGRPDEYGRPTRPQSMPMGKLGVEIYKPSEFSHHDLAAEMLHIDPIANKTREQLLKTWTPKQIETLKHHALDYQATIDEGRSHEDALQNATDSALRGYTVGQWPEEINKKLNYSPKQLKELDTLKMYMKTGQVPMSRKEFIESQMKDMGL